MHAVICKIKIHIPQNQSLKDKRRILKSIIARLRNQYNISVAEVDDHDLWQLATIGIGHVSNSQVSTTGNLVENILKFIRQNYPEVEVIDHEAELMQGF